MSLPCGTIRASLLDRTQTPGPTKNRGVTLGSAKAKPLGTSVGIISTSTHSFGMMEFQASRQQVGQLCPGTASTPSTKPVKVARRTAYF